MQHVAAPSTAQRIMENMRLREAAQRIYMPSFPKAGTHLAELYVRQIAEPITAKPWLGSFRDNAWSTKWRYIGLFERVAKKWPPGHYLKGHCGHLSRIARAMRDNGIAVMFVYRDLRGVAISQAHHVLSNELDEDGEQALRHPGKATYQALENFEQVVIAVIEGIDRWPGLIDRWKLYEGWLDEEWVLPLRYRDMVRDKYRTAEAILEYVAWQTAEYYGAVPRMSQRARRRALENMVGAATHMKQVTFRRGVVDGWRDEWTGAMQDAFERVDGPAYNERIINPLGVTDGDR